MSFLDGKTFGIQQTEEYSLAPGAGPGNGSASPSPPMTPGGSAVAAFLVQKNIYTDSQVATGAIFNLCLGGACIMGFVLFRFAGVAFYKSRLLLPEVLEKPPLMALSFPRVIWSWIRPVFALSDAELIRTAGLDALIFHRAFTFGIQFFGPVTILACVLLLPVYLSGPRVKRNPGVTFGKFTMSNLELGSQLYWLTLVYAVLVIAYGQWLLIRFYKEYVELHQRYLVRGEAMLNEWHIKKINRRTGSINVKASRQRKLGDLVEEKPPGQEGAMQRTANDSPSANGSGAIKDMNLLDTASAPLKTIDWSPDVIHEHPISEHETVEKSDAGDSPRAGARIIRWWRPTHMLMTAAGRPVEVSRSPVPFRKIISTNLPDGSEVSVNAQQYVVLASDVPAPPQPSEAEPKASFWDSLPALPWFLSYLRPLGGPFTADLRMELASTELISADKIPTSPSDAALCAKEAAAGGMSGVSVPAASGKDHACDKSDPEVGVRGATEQRGTHTGHYELAPVHKMFMHRASSSSLGRTSSSALGRLGSPGLPSPNRSGSSGLPSAGSAGGPMPSFNRRSSEISANRPPNAFSVEQGPPQRAPKDPAAASSSPGPAVSRWKGLATAYQTANTAVAFATTKASDSPDGKTGEHGSAAAAAAAANANATGAADGGTDEGEEAEVELGGQGLVEAVFRGMFPDNFQEVVPVRNHKALDLLMFKWDSAYRQLEIAEAMYLESEKTKRPTHRLGCCGCSGETVDSINFYCAQIRELESKIFEEKSRLLTAPPVTNSYFVIFNSQSAAAAAAQCCIFPEGAADAFRVMPAPGPEEVNWQMLWVGKRKRAGLRLAGWILLTVVIIFPIGIFTGAVTNITNAICSREPFAKSAFCISKSHFKSLITAVLPPLLLTLWQNLFMPMLVYRGAQLLCKKPSLSGLDRLIFSLFFIWGILTVLIGGIVGGSILTYLSPDFISRPDRIYELIGPALSSASNFFINYVIFQGFFMIPYRLFSPTFFPLFTMLRKCRLLPKPKGRRAEMEALYPHFNIRMGCELGRGFMLICTITLANAAVSPIILPFALWWCFASWIMWRYSILYVFERSSESGGMIWHQIFDKLIWSFFIFGFFTGCVMITNKAIIQGGILIVLTPIWMRVFYNYAAGRFGKEHTAAPLLLAAGAPPAVVDPAIYTAPALRPGCAGWYPEYGKAWEHWGMPAYAF